MAPELQALARESLTAPISGGAVVYISATRRLYGLNAPASEVWTAIREGLPPEGMATRLSTLFGLDSATAENWRDLAIASFAGFIEQSGDEVPGLVPLATQARMPFPPGIAYSLLSQRVHVDATPELLPVLDSVLGVVRPPVSEVAAGDLWIQCRPDGAKIRVTSGGDPPTTETLRTLAPDVERRIVQDIIPGTPHILAFHAALLSKGDRAVILAAPSGSGKTTLAIVLAASGWSMHTDEVALLGPDGTWRGLPFRPCVKAENYALVEELVPQLGEVIEHDRYGRQVKFLPISMTDREVAATTVVFPRYRAERSTAVSELDPGPALAELLGQCLFVPQSFGEAEVKRLADWHDKVRYFAVEFADVRQAAALIDEGDIELA